MVSNARQLAQVPSVPSGRRNLIINGGFEVAQRGTSFTADNIYTLDRWKSSDGSGGTPARTTTQETFSLGQTDVPNAAYFLKHNQTAASTNGNASLNQRIEDVTRFDDVTVTLSFYAKADAALTVDAQFIQNFGSGGSPSSSVTVTETGISIGTSWQKYTVTKDLGSLSGKTLGSDGRHTSFLTTQIEFDDTGTFTFEIAQVQLEYGSVATEFEHRSYGEELALCQRYFEYASEKNFHAQPIWFINATGAATRLHFVVPKRTRSYTTGYAGTIGTGSSDHRIYYSGAYRAFSTMTFSSSGKALKSMRVDFGTITGGASGGAGGYYNVGSSTVASHIYADDELQEKV